MTEAPRILIVEARFYDDLADALLEGAKETLKARGADFDVITVPGALEIPAAIAQFLSQGRSGAISTPVILGVILMVVAVIASLWRMRSLDRATAAQAHERDDDHEKVDV